jgi:hypothetical protein
LSPTAATRRFHLLARLRHTCGRARGAEGIAIAAGAAGTLAGLSLRPLAALLRHTRRGTRGATGIAGVTRTARAALRKHGGGAKTCHYTRRQQCSAQVGSAMSLTHEGLSLPDHPGGHSATVSDAIQLTCMGLRQAWRFSEDSRRIATVHERIRDDRAPRRASRGCRP